MALKKTQIALIAKILHVKESDIDAALASTDEVELTIPDKLVTFDETELANRDGVKYKEGKVAGEEMTAKVIKKLVGGEDVPDGEISAKTLTAVKTHMEAVGAAAVTAAKIPPNDQVQEKEKVIAGLRQKLTDAEGLVNTEKANAQLAKNDATLLGLLPANRDDRFSNDQYLTLIKGDFELVDDGGIQALKSKKTGEIVKAEKDLKTLPASDAIAKHFETSKWLKEEAGGGGGRGGGNSNPGGKPGTYNKMSDLRKHAETNNISIQGDEFGALVKTALKDNPAMVMD